MGDNVGCPATGKRTNERDCYGRSSTSGFNRDFCTGENGKGCISPWRVCPACVVQEEFGSKVNASFMVISGKGLCRFHLTNGAEARRNGNGGVPTQAKDGNGKAPTTQTAGRAKKQVAKPAREKRPEKKNLLSRTATFEQVVDGVVVEITLLPLKPGQEDVVIQAKVEDILPYAKQPRSLFDQGSIVELSRSLSAKDQKQSAILTPIKTSEGSYKWMLVDGERRFRATKKAGRGILKAELRGFATERDLYREAAIANDHRKPLTELEEARKIKMMVDEFEMSIDDVADELGMSGLTARNRLTLLSFEPEMQELMDPSRPRSSKLGSTDACSLKGLPVQMQRDLVRLVNQDGKGIKQALGIIRRRAERDGHSIGTQSRKMKPSDVTKSVKSFFSSIVAKEQAFNKNGLSSALKGLKMGEIEDLKREHQEAMKALTAIGKKF